MNRTAQETDERLNELVTEVADLTGENYVTAMCQAMEERRDRLVSKRREAAPDRVIRLTLEISLV
jgi:hypothetical protein